MPELPEVETIIQGLRAHLIGQRITQVDLIGKSIFKKDPLSSLEELTHRKIIDITRHGKSIYFHLLAKPSDGRPPVLWLVHLGMTGQLLWMGKGDKIENHTHLLIQFENSDYQLRYRDIRRFGKMEVIRKPWSVPLVPDAWLSSNDEIYSSLRKKKGMVKHVLLNQHVVAGLGNIYVDESLHKAKIHPRRDLAKIKPEQLMDLCRTIKSVLSVSIQLGGTSFRNYVDINGGKGGNKRRLSVYGKEGRPCFCGGRIKKIVVAGRGTHFCPRCQPSPR